MSSPKEERWTRFCGSEFEAWIVQWTMNSALAEIGVHFPKLRKRAIAIGEKMGINRDYPVSNGYMSPFAPIWINFMVSRQGK